MRVGELVPGQRIIHPTTGSRVEVVEVKRVSKMLRVYFKSHGEKGWFMVGSNDQEVLSPER
jgi:hypothetical protein